MSIFSKFHIFVRILPVDYYWQALSQLTLGISLTLGLMLWQQMTHWRSIAINTVMNQVSKWCLLFRDLFLILTMFSGCCVWIPHYNGAWLAVCDTVTVLLSDIVLLAFEKFLGLFSGHRKTAFLQLHKFLFTTAPNFLQLHNLCTTAHYKPWCSPSVFRRFDECFLHFIFTFRLENFVRYTISYRMLLSRFLLFHIL